MSRYGDKVKNGFSDLRLQRSHRQVCTRCRRRLTGRRSHGFVDRAGVVKLCTNDCKGATRGV